MARLTRKKAEIILIVEEIILEIVFLFSIFISRNRYRGQIQNSNVERLVRYSMNERIPKQIQHMSDLVGLRDDDCLNNLRMNRATFNRLCYLLQHSGGLVDKKYVTVAEQVALFLSVLAHHSKVRVVKFDFKRSGHTVNKYFHDVLKAVLSLHETLLAKPSPIDNECTHPRWKHFQGCLGALDGTYVDVTVPEADKARYRTRKGTISVNVLAACDLRMRFIYMLTGWEGSAADARVLRDAISRPNGFKIPQVGVGVDSTTNMVDATDEQWEAAIKRDPNARGMRNKSWPLYEAWCEIFGATRATGEAAEDFVNAAAPASGSQPTLNPDGEANNDSILIMEETQGESKAPSGYTQTGESSAMGKLVSGRKRKTAVIEDPLIPIMSSFCDTAAARLGEIAQRIGYEQDMSTARKEVYKLVSKMNLLTVKEKLRVTRLICRNSEDLDVFFSLPDAERTEWAMMLLNDDI